MRKPHSQMTLISLESAVSSYENCIVKWAGNAKAISRYKTKLKDANKWYEIRLEEIRQKSAKTFRKEDKEFHKRLDVLFTTPFENNFFQQFIMDLRKHLQNRI